ncbi:MAG: AIR synthase-related protein, partial [Pseudomonadales bacterium]
PFDKNTSLGRALLEPTRIYVKSCLAALAAGGVNGFAHITGGGLLENLPRMFAERDLAALIDMDSWDRPGVFSWLQQAGNIDELEMLRTFNCGVGFVICVAAEDAERACRLLIDLGETAKPIGRIVAPDTPAGTGQLTIPR